MSERSLGLMLLGVTAALFIAMPAWHVARDGGNSYAAHTDLFLENVENQIAAFKTGAEEDGVPVVRPPAGDVFLSARRWSWYPVLELEVGKTYRLHVASADIQHGLHLEIDGAHRLLLPGTVRVIELTPSKAGRFAIVCSDFCGIQHNKMSGFMSVVEAKSKN
jgi:cytochrome c oxidase subunit 2